MKLEAATRPTMYFIGVTTGSSSIMKVFPEWVKYLGIDAQIKGIDIAIHEKPEVYREVVDFIKNDPLSLGALVTTHKIDIYAAAHDMFAVSYTHLDVYKRQCMECWKMHCLRIRTLMQCVIWVEPWICGDV